MGLSQPLDGDQVKAERAVARLLGAWLRTWVLDGIERQWPIDALYAFLAHITDGEVIRWGIGFQWGSAIVPMEVLAHT